MEFCYVLLFFDKTSNLQKPFFQPLSAKSPSNLDIVSDPPVSGGLAGAVRDPLFIFFLGRCFTFGSSLPFVRLVWWCRVSPAFRSRLKVALGAAVMHVRIFRGRGPDPCFLLAVQFLSIFCDLMGFRQLNCRERR